MLLLSQNSQSQVLHLGSPSFLLWKAVVNRRGFGLVAEYFLKGNPLVWDIKEYFYASWTLFRDFKLEWQGGRKRQLFVARRMLQSWQFATARLATYHRDYHLLTPSNRGVQKHFYCVIWKSLLFNPDRINVYSPKTNMISKVPEIIFSLYSIFISS